ncbi:hypothetical protein Rsub_01011 [Raphidocelis subcapitata]|uniref:Uncharacterized protein n=1 Tax=Raphidocelis subcapitata TaxID=307507 RepID=A0A2V0NME3_9CHLO|nr:hypothetical protein Rsub_01011 [Raphidocelis subcapitata]|eukprot:GBF88299.1 hypothetical protein Rsub_01011 [Raphidocelis subcapitata]
MPACWVCETSKKAAFLCQGCINAQLFDDKKRELRQQRDELQQRLEAALAQRAAAEQQQLELWRWRRRVEAARSAQAAAEGALKQELRRHAGERAAVDRRRAAAERALSDLAADRAKALGGALPTQIRYQSLTLSHVSAMLAREQRLHMRALLEILPIRINALRAASATPDGEGGGGGGSPIQITISNLRLPESMVVPASGWQDPLAVSAALGYLLLLVDKVAFIMGGPVLHEAHHQGSTSSVWMPGSFWDRAPRRRDHVLPLFVPGAAGGGGGGGGAGGGGAGAGPALARSGSSSSGGSGSYQRQAGAGAGGGFWQMALGARGAVASDGGGGPRASDASTSGGGGTPRSMGLLSSRRDVDTQAAFALLQRSLAVFLRDKAAASSLQLPAAWNPLAWLVVFCAVVKRDVKADGKLVAASLAADAAAGGGGRQTPQQQQQQDGGSDAGGGSAATPCSPRDGLDSGSVLALLDGGGAGLPQPQLPVGPWDPAWAFDGDDDDEEDEGWGVVRAPFLPPPPSRPEDVEQWTRAMITDTAGGAGGGGGGGGRAPGGGGAGGGGPLASAALLAGSPGSGAILSVDYIRQLFGKQ